MPSSTGTYLIVTYSMSTTLLSASPSRTRWCTTIFIGISIQTGTNACFTDTHGIAIVFASTRRTRNTFPSSTTKTCTINTITSTVTIVWTSTSFTIFTTESFFTFTKTIISACTTSTTSFGTFLQFTHFTMVPFVAQARAGFFVTSTSTVTLFKIVTNFSSVFFFSFNVNSTIICTSRTKEGICRV